MSYQSEDDGFMFGFTLFILIFGIGLGVFFSWVLTTGDDPKFTGYCEALHGTVHDDVCVSDDKVVAYEKDLKE